MGAENVLREYRNVDEKIRIEAESIEMGKAFAKEFYNTIRGAHYTESGVKSGGRGDAVCDAATVLCEEQAEMRREMRDREWAHLMEYRRLMELKLVCSRILASMPDKQAEIVRERAVDGRNWAQIAKKFAYSESQVKRLYRDGMVLFLSEYAAGMAGV